MSVTDGLEEPIRRMRAMFVVPPADDELCSRVMEFLKQASSEYRGIGDTFNGSLVATLRTVSMPFAMASAAAHGRHYQRLHAAESIRALNLEVPEGEDPEALRHRVAHRKADEAMSAFEASEEGQRAIIRDTCHFLLDAGERGGMAVGASELLMQCTILLWSAFEVLCRDVFEVHLNAAPQKARALATDPVARRRFDVAIGLDTLEAHGFDVASRMGSILVAQQDFSDLITIKASLLALAPGAARLREALDAKELWLLAQRRHLLVHRRGIIDAKYLASSGDTGTVGERLVITPRYFDAAVALIADTGATVLTDLSAQHP